MHGGSQAAFRQIEGFFTPSLRLPVPETLTESRPPAAICVERVSSDLTPTTGNGRYLRTAAVHCVVFTWLKSPEGDVHLPEGEGAKLTRRSIGTRVLRRPSVDRRLPVMAGRGSRLVLDPLQRAFRTLCGGPDGPITTPPDLADKDLPRASLTSFMAMDSPEVVTDMNAEESIAWHKAGGPGLGPSKECSLSHAPS